MKLTRRGFLVLGGMGGAAAVAACKRSRVEEKPQEAVEPEPIPEEEAPTEPEVDLDEFESLAIDMGAWSYDEENNCYYQLGLPYCLKPGSEQYGSLSLFVPGDYFVATQGRNSYVCEVSEDATVGDFTARTAPIAMPINATSFGAQASLSTYAYEGLGRYLAAGFIYVYVGFRGRSGGYESTTQEYYAGGAPWPVSDLKAAVRWLRYNAAVLPGDTNRIFAFGQGGGGGLVATLGTSGNSSSYEPYLSELGAVTHDAEGLDITDDIYGVAAWCPICSLGAADAAYEWMMGQYDDKDTRGAGTWTKMLSDDLSKAYGTYVNGLGLLDDDGNELVLDQIEDGSYGGGSYYDYLVDVVADAAKDFFERTPFPYTEIPSAGKMRVFPGDPSLSTADATDLPAREGDEAASASGVRQVQVTVYDTLESYVSSLNGTNRWLTYNANRGAVDVTGLWDFVAHCRPAASGVCAYDLIDRSGVVNQLFGTEQESSLHFDRMAADLIEKRAKRYSKAEGWDEELVAAYRGDLVEPDALDVSVADRVDMMDPLHFLQEDEDGKVPNTARRWRINTGLFQSDTTLSGEVNLARALAQRDGVDEVLFEAVWGTGFGLAEREGDAEDNLVGWIRSCCQEDSDDDAPEAADA